MILSNPKNLYWFLPLVLVLLLAIYKTMYNSVVNLLNSDLEAQRLFLAEENNVDPSEISNKDVEDSIYYTAIVWGNLSILFAGIVIIIAVVFFGL